MLLAAVKLASPILVSLAVLLGSVGSAFGSDQLTMTNISGQAGDCRTPASGGICAPLFTGDTLLVPGRQIERRVAIGYHGGRPTRRFGVYATDFHTRSAASAPYCTAPDPADKLDLVIREDGQTIYDGTLATFAAAHDSPRAALPVGGGRWTDGRHSTFTLAVSLDPAAGNAYMGCVSTAGLAWYAA